MTLLLLLAFEPATSHESGGNVRSDAAAPVRTARKSLAPSESASAPVESPRPAPSAPKSESLPADLLSSSAPGPDIAPPPAPITSSVAATPSAIADIADWPAFIAGMKLSGIALQLAAQT